MSLDISGPMKNNGTSLPASGKDTCRGHAITISADSNTYPHIYESKSNAEKYHWPNVASMPYFKALKMVNME